MSNSSSEQNSGDAKFGQPSEQARKLLSKRKRADGFFQMAGLVAILFAVAALGWLTVSIVGTGMSAFTRYVISVDVELTESVLDPSGARDPVAIRGMRGYRGIIQNAMYVRVPEAEGRQQEDDAYDIISASGAENMVRQMLFNDPSMVGQTVTIEAPVSDDIEQLLKGHLAIDVPEEQRRVSNNQIRWVEQMQADGVIQSRFNSLLFLNPDSTDPELAGIGSAIVGSVMAMLVTLLLAFPIGVGAAIYLEEYAPKNAWSDFIEINISNLAAVPSIVFGLLGLAVFLNTFGLPRSAPLVGGIVLAFMTFPTIMITTRAALKAVPGGIYDGALSIGASHTQAIFHHKLPNAIPGILTGSIIGMARALGETAPLLMIGMASYVTSVPTSIMDPASALPVQIFWWSGNAEIAWEERASAAIIILLGVLMTINALAIWLRHKLEKRW